MRRRSVRSTAIDLTVRQHQLFQQVGLAIMLFIMVLVTFNDLNQMVFHRIMALFE